MSKEQHYCETREGSRHICSLCKEEKSVNLQLLDASRARCAELEKALMFYARVEMPDDFQNKLNKSGDWINCNVTYKGPSKASRALTQETVSK